MPYGLFIVDLHVGSLYQREAIGLDLFQKVSATFSDAVLYMLVRIIEIRAGDHTGELLAETFAYFYYIRTEIIPYPEILVA